MSERKGSISVDTADIFPIIKKWLYSEHDIFIRELVANATDAITKRSTMARTKNQEIPHGRILVSVNKTNKTLKVVDNGIGMTEAEVEKYIAQLAFSGAEEFVKKLEQAKDQDIIGKFGLGFYSSFMVADHVVVDSLSMDEGATPVKWSCKGDTEYVFTEGERKEVGTTVTLHINEQNEEFLDEYKISETLRRFCAFMPYPIEVVDEEKTVYPKKEDGSDDTSKEASPAEPRQINDTEPLWKKDPTTLKDEDYKNFFRKLYPMDPEPLFWLHLRVDHPFTLEGILYFPKLTPQRPLNENNIRLYSKQVFVSDNVKNIIPDFLGLLKGVIDSVDIPLNVSRSSLQGDPNVRRISGYVVRKVAESLKRLFKDDREKYEGIWEDTGLFIKYGCASDVKFDELMRQFVVFRNSEEKYVTLGEYRESIPEKYKEKIGDTVLYFEKNGGDASLKRQLLEEGLQSIETDQYIDPHFMQHAEMHKQGEHAVKFASVDSMIEELLETESANEEDMKIRDLFKNLLGDQKEEAFEVEVKKLRNSPSPAYFKADEQMKRFQRMAESMGQQGAFPLRKTLVVNPSNPLVQNLYRIHETGGKEELVKKLCKYVEDLAYISAEGLRPEDRDRFVTEGQDLLRDLTSTLTS